VPADGRHTHQARIIPHPLPKRRNATYNANPVVRHDRIVSVGTLREGRMELYWTKRMSVGNETMDSEHIRILELVNAVDGAIRNRDETAFARALERLEETARIHFGNEEKIAQAIGFPFEEHNLEHAYILDQFSEIKAQLAAHRGAWSESMAEYYYEFLSTWAVDHVLEDDMQMKILLETYPYDFRPKGLTGLNRA